jgi:uncharacterized protein with GYD domain
VAKYLLEVSYQSDGAKGLIKDGGTKRRQVAEQAIASAGGKLEEFYFAFGHTDAFVIVDAPDHATIAAASVALNASGAVRARTIVLMTPEEMDKATKKTVTYTAPGH